MPNYWFFFSYARDQDALNRAQEGAGPLRSYQEQFFLDLVEEIHRRYGRPGGDEEVGFIDLKIPTGQIWRERLGAALNTCRCFVYLQEPNYFRRDWCGKEWSTFRRRIEAFLRTQPVGADPPLLTIPLQWVPAPIGELPPLANELQLGERDLGDVYPRVGVYDMIYLAKHKEDYKEFLPKLAKLIYERTKAHSVPPLDAIPSFDEAANPFLPSPGPGAASGPAPRPWAPSKGAVCASFVYVAASHDEIANANVRRLIDAYRGDADEWLPYHPASDEPAYFLAQAAATNRRLKYEKMVVGPDLVVRLDDARRAGKIVVLIVDSWSLKIDGYRTAMENYVDRNFYNSVVVVPWNEDEETREQAEELRALLADTFIGLNEDAMRFRVVSSDRFRQELDDALNDRLGFLMRASETRFRRVQGSGPRQRQAISAVRADR
jgi:FxsC-like protein